MNSNFSTLLSFWQNQEIKINNIKESKEIYTAKKINNIKTNKLDELKYTSCKGAYTGRSEMTSINCNYFIRRPRNYKDYRLMNDDCKMNAYHDYKYRHRFTGESFYNETEYGEVNENDNKIEYNNLENILYSFLPKNLLSYNYKDDTIKKQSCFGLFKKKMLKWFCCL